MTRLSVAFFLVSVSLVVGCEKFDSMKNAFNQESNLTKESFELIYTSEDANVWIDRNSRKSQFEIESVSLKAELRSRAKEMGSQYADSRIVLNADCRQRKTRIESFHDFSTYGTIIYTQYQTPWDDIGNFQNKWVNLVFTTLCP